MLHDGHACALPTGLGLPNALQTGSRQSSVFPRRLRMDRQRMHGVLEFRRERRINHAMALDPALPFEGRRHNIYPEMRFAAGLVAGMTFMQM